MSLLNDLTAITTPALTDIVYCVQNSTDYKVTNEQLIALSKTNIIIPKTQAQYDALTPAEKNNGALYIITDAVITADDVEYASGVSVADKIDALIDDTTTSQASTWSSDKISGEIEAVSDSLEWVDASSEFTAGAALDSGQAITILYNSVMKMYFLSFAVKANTTDNIVIFTNVPTMAIDVLPLTTGAANAGALTPTQYSAVYLRGNNSIWFRTSQSVNVPVFVQGFLFKA